MVLAERHGDKIWVEADNSDKDRLLTLPGARYDRENQVVVLPLSYAACKQLRGILGERLDIGDNLYDWASKEVAGRVVPCLELRNSLEPYGRNWDERLYPYQKAGAEFLIKSRFALLSDPMGAGKTATAVSAARAVIATPALVVCPNSTKHSWKREIETWWPGTPVYVLEGTKKQRQEILNAYKINPGFLVINWEAVRLHSRLAPYGSMRLSETERLPKELNDIPWELLIVDEGHRMKDPTSKQTRAVWAIGENTPWRWVLTGTPLTDTPETLYPILHFLDPNEWPSKTAFINRYCDSAPSRWGPGLDVFGLSEATKEEFFEIFDPRFRRMPKEVILPFLPPIQYERRDIDMSDTQAAAYRTMSEDLIAEDENGELIIAVNPISKLTRLLQYSSASLELIDGAPKLGGPSNKIDQLMADLDDYLTAGESVVVFALHRQLIEMAEVKLRAKKIPFSVIKGGQSEAERQKNIDNFQNGSVNVILVVIAAGGVGITLTAGRVAIFLQRPWSNVDHKQAMGRVHRIGSEIHESIIIVDYVSRRTVENYQLQALQGKAQQLEAVVRDRETIERILRGDELETEEGI